MLRNAASSSSLLKAVPFARAFCAFEGAVLRRTRDDAAAMRSPFEMAELTESEEKIAQLAHESEHLTAD
jgi:hypothetical protein